MRPGLGRVVVLVALYLGTCLAVGIVWGLGYV